MTIERERMPVSGVYLYGHVEGRLTSKTVLPPETVSCNRTAQVLIQR